MAKRRLELEAGNSSKSKKATKKKATKKKATKKKATKKKATTPALTVHSHSVTVGVFPDGKSLWLVGGYELPRKLPADGAGDEALDDMFYERWRFKSPKEVKAATKALAAEKVKRGSLPDWFEGSPSAFAEHVETKEQPRIARFALAKKGPATLERHGTFDWVFLRPPSHCGCGRVMTPTYELRGAIDKRLGNKPHVYVSFCPGGLADRYCETSIEVLVQRGEDKSPTGVHYYETRRGYCVIAESVHWDAIGPGHTYVITEHWGDKGETGVHTSTRFRDEKEARAFLSERKSRAGKYYQPAKPNTVARWYRAPLERMRAFHRVKAEKHGVFPLAPAIAPMHASGTCYSMANAVFDKSDGIGGQPNYTQSDAFDSFPCPSCGADTLFLFQVGAGAPWWSDILNDGDAGSFQFLACTKCKGPFGRAVFECH